MSPRSPRPRYKYDLQSTEWREYVVNAARHVFFFFFQSDLISTNARSTTIRRYREDRRKEEGKGGRERKKTKAYRVTGSLSGGEIPPP